jgi:hypothetical protein
MLVRASDRKGTMRRRRSRSRELGKAGYASGPAWRSRMYSSSEASSSGSWQSRLKLSRCAPERALRTSSVVVSSRGFRTSTYPSLNPSSAPAGPSFQVGILSGLSSRRLEYHAHRLVHQRTPIHGAYATRLARQRNSGRLDWSGGGEMGKGPAFVLAAACSWAELQAGGRLLAGSLALRSSLGR